MASNTGVVWATLRVVVLLSVVCSVVVSGTAVGLRERQQTQKKLDRQRNILAAARLLQPGQGDEAVAALFKKRVTPRLVDLESGSWSSEDPTTTNEEHDLKDPRKSRSLPANLDLAHIQRRINLKPIYLIKDNQGKVSTIVLPINGSGLWSMMYAFLALEKDSNTIAGLVYYEQGETPGLGGEVSNPSWQKKWIGKQLFDRQNKMALHLVKGGSGTEERHAVDALSGATLTSNGVQNMVNFWLGDVGYGPFLAKIRRGELNYDR